MREIVVVSGKGGTGKTSLTVALAHLAAGQAVLADLDVDAANLHLVLQPRLEAREDFVSGHVAQVDPQRCTGCGRCQEVCRFGAVVPSAAGVRVEAQRCEGCKTCVALCPAEAMEFLPRRCGEWMRSHTRLGPLVHARLDPGGENSGRLVGEVKRQARQWAAALHRSLVLADGPPGVGCPVIAALAQAGLAVVVTEPTPSGLHDLRRVAAVCQRLRVPVAVVGNQWDLAPEVSLQVEAACQEQGWPVVARLPHDPAVPRAMAQGLAVTEWDAAGPWAQAVRPLWPALMQLVEKTGGIQ